MKRVLILTDLTPASREACVEAMDWLRGDAVHTALGFIHPSVPQARGLLIRVEQVHWDTIHGLQAALGAQESVVCGWAEMQQRIRSNQFDLVVLTAGAPQANDGGQAIPEHFIQSWGVPVVTFPSSAAHSA